MKFLNFVIFVSLLSMNVKSLGFNLYWNDLLRWKRTDSSTNKGYIGMTYSMLPNGVRQMHTLTVTVRAGSRLPKSSKMLITAEMSTITQK